MGWVKEVSGEGIGEGNGKSLSDGIGVVVGGFDKNGGEGGDKRIGKGVGNVEGEREEDGEDEEEGDVGVVEEEKGLRGNVRWGFRIRVRKELVGWWKGMRIVIRIVKEW